jgi:hypothetical protein
MSTTTTEKKPSYKQEVVVALMQPVGQPYFEETKAKEGKIVNKQYVKYQYPKGRCNFISAFELKSGYSNPYAHLSSCYGPETLLKLYKEAVLHHKKQGGTIESHFKVASASEYDKAMYFSA